MLRHIASLFSCASPIKLVSVDLGTRSIRIPVAEIVGNRPGRTLLVTGGTDGDEYAGVEAAYALVDKYASGDIAGRLVVIPILNLPGFEAECSVNPMDGRFPKMVGLGKVRGTASERLMRWLADAYALRADAWIDLHGGAITEGVRPFLWLFETGVREADLLAQSYLRSCGADTVLFEPCVGAGKAVDLARGGCMYALAESGARGRRDKEDIERHVAWTEALMRELGMIQGGVEAHDPPRILRRARYVYAPFAGIWRPAEFSPDAIVQGTVIGTCAKLDGTGERKIPAPTSGVGLWWKETMAMREGDILLAIGGRD
jgi:hypothetical protein